MKNILPIFVILLFAQSLIAQFNEQQLVRIDYANDNALTQLAVIPNSYWPEKEYCFDQVNGRYIFTGIGLQDYGLHVVDVQTGEILAQSDIESINNAQGHPAYEFHTDFELIYTLRPTFPNGLGVDFYSVNPLDGQYTKISTISETISWNSTLSALDSENDIYFMLHEPGQTMYKIDIMDGSIIESKFLDGYYFRQLYFDPINKKLVALGKANGAEFFTLVDIDPVNLVMSNFRLIDGLTNTKTGMTQGDGMSAFDPEQQLFFQVGINNGDKLLVIDLENGEILHSNPFIIGPGSGPDFMVKHGIEKLAYDTKNDQLLGLVRDDLLPSSVKFVEADQELIIYPNPAQDLVSISWERAGAQRVELFDALGKSVMFKEVNSNEFSVNLDVSQLEKGYYTAVVYNSDDTASVRKLQKF